MNDYDGNLRADIARLEAECDRLHAELELARSLLRRCAKVLTRHTAPYLMAGLLAYLGTEGK